MFLDYFGLNEQPFGVTPDPRFLYLGPKHRQALAALDYGTEAERGFLALIAQPGMGKTSLLFQYLQDLHTKARTAFVFQTDGDSRDLMRYLLADLGLSDAGKDLPEMHALLNRTLLEEVRAGRQFVLVIDEAQNLDEKVLESVRLLSNFETPQKKLMQIVLAGQPQLAARLASPSMAQLRQRISFIIRIEPLAHEEVAAYVDHRLFVAGYKGPSLFTEGARLLIAEHSQGIPRNINNLCFNALTLGWALKQRTIDREMLCDIVADLDLNPAITAPTQTRGVQSAVAVASRVARVEPAIAASLPIANTHRAERKPTTSPPAESASVPRPGAEVNEAHSVRSTPQATAIRASRAVAPGTKTPQLLSTLLLGVRGSSRKSVVLVPVLIVFVVVAGMVSYRLYGSRARLSEMPVQQQQVNLPQDAAASPALLQVTPVDRGVMTASFETTPVSRSSVDTSQSVVDRPANRNDVSLLPPVHTLLSKVGPNTLVIGDPAPVPTTVPSPSDPIEAASVTIQPASDPAGAANAVLAGIETMVAAPSPNVRPLVGGQLQPPQLISSTPPVYPASARARGVQGVVILDALVDETGKVVDTTVISGPMQLRTAAQEALRIWKYQPARLNGEPIQAHINVNAEFRLK
jgi:general secretion pathway protein A